MAEIALETPAHYSFGAAVAPDGAVWFTEFNRQNLRRFDPTSGRTETRRTGIPGVYGVAVAPDGAVFVGQDLGDSGSPGKVLRLGPTAGADVVVSGITRPRQLACDRDGNLYVVCEANPPSLLKWVRATGRVETVPIALKTPQGIAAAADGTLFVSEYGAAGQVPGRVLAWTPGGAARTLAAGFWRARGLALAGGALYVTTEADAEDHGNSGRLVRIAPKTGATTVVHASLDYPQFPAAGADGRLWFAINRDGWLAACDPKSAWTPQPGPLDLRARGGTVGLRGRGVALTVTADALRYELRVASEGGGAVDAWLTVPASRLRLPLRELYTDRGDPEHPQPGLFALPTVAAHAERGGALAHVVALRGHVGKRWPMTNVGTKDEAPPADFSESPTAYRIFLRWRP